MVPNTKLIKCTCSSAFNTGKCNCDGSGATKHEVIVKLADGCTVRSGSAARLAGDYIRICNPNNEEIAYWHCDEWENEPILTMGAIINFMAGKRIAKTVDMIASGYEWDCPYCDELNTEIEIYNEVECTKCNSRYKIGDVAHAYH